VSGGTQSGNSIRQKGAAGDTAISNVNEFIYM
jgi:hypothetical protein